jgi:hypothetical protein
MIVAPRTRVSVRVADPIRDESVSTEVVSEGAPLVVERALYAERGGLPFSHGAVATAEPSATWAFPEGSTGPGFETWLLLANPQPDPVIVTVYFQSARAGTVLGTRREIPARARTNVRVNDLLLDPEVASLVYATAPVYAERATYITAPGRPADATASPGAARSAAEWLVAEGAAADGFETWILVQNPHRVPVTVAVTFLTPEGVVAPAALSTLTVAPDRRATIRVNDWLRSDQVSTRVRATGGGVVVERASYYDRPERRGAVTDLGSERTDTVWYAGEGATAGGYDTWLLVANPGMFAGRVQVTYLTPMGTVDGPRVRIESGRRISIRELDGAGEFYNVAALVSSLDGAPIAVERVTFSPSGAQGGRALPAHDLLDAANL